MDISNNFRLAFSRRRSCQISVIFKLSTVLLRGVTAKQAVLRLHRVENKFMGLYYQDFAATPQGEKPKRELLNYK